MKTYQQLWQSITPLYEAGEAQAIVRTVLDVKKLSEDCKKANLYSMFWAKQTLPEEPSM